MGTNAKWVSTVEKKGAWKGVAQPSSKPEKPPFADLSSRHWLGLSKRGGKVLFASGKRHNEQNPMRSKRPEVGSTARMVTCGEDDHPEGRGRGKDPSKQPTAGGEQQPL